MRSNSSPSSFIMGVLSRVGVHCGRKWGEGGGVLSFRPDDNVLNARVACFLGDGGEKGCQSVLGAPGVSRADVEPDRSA